MLIRRKGAKIPERLSFTLSQEVEKQKAPESKISSSIRLRFVRCYNSVQLHYIQEQSQIIARYPSFVT